MSQPAAELLTWLQAGSAVVLTIVTSIYVVLTRKMASAAMVSAAAAQEAALATHDGTAATRFAALEASLQRKASSQPLPSVDSGRFEWYGRTIRSIQLFLTNYGGGPAFGTHVYLQLPNGTRLCLKIATAVAPGTAASIALPIESKMTWADLRNASCWIACHDVFGTELWWVQTVVANHQTGVLDVLSAASPLAGSPLIGCAKA